MRFERSVLRARFRAHHKCATGGGRLPSAHHPADVEDHGAYCASRESTTHQGQQNRGVGA